MITKPNFFIVGAAKSGTTSLYKYLHQHPDVYFSPIKEPNYFSDDIDISKFSNIYKKNNFLAVDRYFSHKELKPLQLTFVRESNHYQRLFENSSDHKIIGEASTSYLYSESAAKNIFEYNPQAKIVAILRNPIERAFSHYQMAVRYGYTKLSFKEALEKDQKAPVKGWGISELFIELGMYHDQLKRYFAIFPASQIKVILFDELVNDLTSAINLTCDFLGIDHLVIRDSEIFNVGKTPKYIWLNYVVTKFGLKNLIKRILPHKITNQLKHNLFTSVQNFISKEDKNYLIGIYREDIEKTASLLGRDLSDWLS